MIRRIIGFFLLLFGFWCVIFLVMGFEGIIEDFKSLPQTFSAETPFWTKVWEAIKSSFWIFNVLLIYWSLKYGGRLMKSRKRLPEPEEAQG